MKKIALITTSSFLIFTGMIYLVLFTSWGNKLLRPFIENKINQSSPIPLTLAKFHLDTSTLDLLIEVNNKNSFSTKGSYSLLSQSVDLSYTLTLEELSQLQELSKKKLSGKLLSTGKIQGELNNFKIKGTSDLAQSQTDYALLFKELTLHKAAIKSNDAQIQKLLSMSGELPYAQGKIDLHIQLTDLNPKALEGSILVKIKEATLNAKTLKKELGFELKKTALKGEFRAKLEGIQITYLAKLNSELAKIYSKGKIQTTDNAINSIYTLDIKELALFKSLSNLPLRGPFYTKGSVGGYDKNFGIQGESNLADSKTEYSFQINKLKPSKLNLKIKDAHLDKLLYMIGEEKYATAKLNADIQLKDLNPNSLEGALDISLNKGFINQGIMAKHFQVSLPKTNFTLNTRAELSAKNIHYKLSFLSNLASIKSEGNTHPKSFKTDASYALNIKELALLKPLTKSSIRGPLATQGKISGDKKDLTLSGDSKLAKSSTQYKLSLKDFKPNKAELTMKEAEAAKLLYLLGEPNYLEAKLNFQANLTSFSPINGNFNIDMNKGLLHRQEIAKAFDIQLPYTKFSLNSDGSIKEDKVLAKTSLDSNLATLKMQATHFNIQDSSLQSDYEVFIPFLQRLEPLIKRKIYGELRAKGEIKKQKELIITSHSNIFDGRVDVKMVDEKVNADFKDLHIIKILKMLRYKEVMDAPLNGTFVYNTKTQKGRLDSKFDQAVLSRSKMTNLINSFTPTDLSKERFNEGSLTSVINKEMIHSDLQMRSKSVQLKSKKLIFNSKQEFIDANLALTIKKNPADLLIKGNVNNPSVKIDANSLITPEVKEKVGKEINRFLDKLF